MTLTADQLAAAAKGQSVRFSEDGVEFVLVRSEVFDQVSSRLEPQPPDECAVRARIAENTPSDGDLEAAASPPPAAWYQEDWSR